MKCLGFKPGASGWQAQTKPPCYGGRPGKVSFNPGLVISFCSSMTMTKPYSTMKYTLWLAKPSDLTNPIRVPYFRVEYLAKYIMLKFAPGQTNRICDYLGRQSAMRVRNIFLISTVYPSFSIAQKYVDILQQQQQQRRRRCCCGGN